LHWYGQLNLKQYTKNTQRNTKKLTLHVGKTETCKNAQKTHN